MELICTYLLQDIHLLDAGYGTGQSAKSLIELGIGKLTLLDSDPQMLNYAKQKLADEIQAESLMLSLRQNFQTCRLLPQVLMPSNFLT